MNISISSIAYNHGFQDGVENNPKKYKYRKWKWIWQKDSNKKYSPNYEKGYEHGDQARRKFILEYNKTPKNYSEIISYNRLKKEKELREKEIERISNTREEILSTKDIPFNTLEINESKERIKKSISKGEIYWSIYYAEEYFRKVRNIDGYDATILIKGRYNLLKNKSLKGTITFNENSLEEAKLLNSILDLIKMKEL